MKRFIVAIITMFCSGIYGQQDNSSFIRVCYIPDSRCTSTRSSDCGYTFDGNHMVNNSTPKLQNLENFGDNGIVDCEMQLIPLTGEISVRNIEARRCDIVFVGGFGGVACSGNATNHLAAYELTEIKTWSKKETNNLAIVTQVNAIQWGFSPSSGNRNPDIPTRLGRNSTVFDGPFGVVANFNQGGCYQGGYSAYPRTGVRIFAIDSSPNPKTTIAIDNETNDIIVADVDIFTDLGGISRGGRIINQNDVLFANIFALACSISQESEPKLEPIPEEKPVTTIPFISDKRPGYVKTEGSMLNFREDPTTSVNNIKSKIPYGDEVYVLGYQDKIEYIDQKYNKWYKINYKGEEGWVWGEYISFVEEKKEKATVATEISGNYSDLPENIEGTEINWQNTITVKSKGITIYPFDNKKEDGDIVSINVNGVWAKDRYTLKVKKEIPNESDYISCFLNPGKNNYIISKAWNLGTDPPNTLTLIIDDGFSKQEVIINSEIGMSGGIRILLND